jgi:hypothetical protein
MMDAVSGGSISGWSYQEIAFHHFALWKYLVGKGQAGVTNSNGLSEMVKSYLVACPSLITAVDVNGESIVNLAHHQALFAEELRDVLRSNG